MVCEFSQDLSRYVRRNVQLSSHFLSRPLPWPMVPDQQQGLKMRNAIDLVADELINLVLGPVFLHASAAANVQNRLCATATSA